MGGPPPRVCVGGGWGDLHHAYVGVEGGGLYHAYVGVEGGGWGWYVGVEGGGGIFHLMVEKELQGPLSSLSRPLVNNLTFCRFVFSVSFVRKMLFVHLSKRICQNVWMVLNISLKN